MNQTMANESDNETSNEPNKPTDESDQTELVAWMLPPMGVVSSCCFVVVFQVIATVILKSKGKGHWCMEFCMNLHWGTGDNFRRVLKTKIKKLC